MKIEVRITAHVTRNNLTPIISSNSWIHLFYETGIQIVFKSLTRQSKKKTLCDIFRYLLIS